MSARSGFWSSLALAALLSLGFVAPAHALTILVTPELSAASGDVLFCRVVNEGPKVVTVKTQIVRNNGDVLFEFEELVFPGHSETLTVAGSVAARCRFIGTFTKSLVRGSIDVKSGDRSIVVAPAE